MKKDGQPDTKAQRIKFSAIFSLIGLLIGGAIYYFADLEDPIWIGIWLGLPTFLFLYAGIQSSKFKHTNFFFGINGFAYLRCEDSRENITFDVEINFNDMTDLYAQETEIYEKNTYEHTKYVYNFINKELDKSLMSMTGNYDKNTNLKGQNKDINFCRGVERYWNLHLLDTMDANIQKNGYLVFRVIGNLRDFIKLGIGFITFIKSKGEEFTYQFDEIKNMQVRNGELRIQHNNFERKYYFLKSGNEDVIPLKDLCNREFFFKAVELLLGYTFKWNKS